MKNQDKSSDLEPPRKRKKTPNSDTNDISTSENITLGKPKISINNQSFKPKPLGSKTCALISPTKKESPEKSESLHKDEHCFEVSANAEKPTIVFPCITESNWKNFELRLEGKPLDEITQKLNACIARMHSHETLNKHFMSVHVLRLSIVDALLKRKWNNLLQLVVRLGRNYPDPVYKPFIRNLCDILKHYHPAIRGTDFEEQLDMIKEKHEMVPKRDQGIGQC